MLCAARAGGLDLSKLFVVFVCMFVFVQDTTLKDFIDNLSVLD